MNNTEAAMNTTEQQQRWQIAVQYASVLTGRELPNSPQIIEIVTTENRLRAILPFVGDIWRDGVVIAIDVLRKNA